YRYPCWDILSRVFWADWLQLVCPFLFLHPKTKKGTNNQSRERVVISTKYFRTQHEPYQKWCGFFVRL
ncbi:hypothetical protein, partial [Weissella confusa]|uniref:hypothetical protein n=1 Tax=Weissella confusa TaxID=1583 RepID=UPI002A758611